jgi:hypothetical protein
MKMGRRPDGPTGLATHVGASLNRYVIRQWPAVGGQPTGPFRSNPPSCATLTGFFATRSTKIRCSAPPVADLVHQWLRQSKRFITPTIPGPTVWLLPSLSPHARLLVLLSPKECSPLLRASGVAAFREWVDRGVPGQFPRPL